MRRAVVVVSALVVLALCASTAVAQDADNDGVPDARDACPKTTRSAHVDALGCSQTQIDADVDGVCDKSRPKVRSTGAYALTKWCRGLDNCKFVHNHDQADGNGNGRGDACDTGTVAGAPHRARLIVINMMQGCAC